MLGLWESVAVAPNRKADSCALVLSDTLDVNFLKDALLLQGILVHVINFV